MSTQPTATPDQPQQDFNPWLIYAFCFGIAAVFMFFFGLNSPIHTFNSHCDYQWFITMGRGMLAGKVPYRDLFEQKGPIVYAVFAVACWFPHEQFVIWCLEVLCVSLFLYFCYRISRKFLSPWLSLVVVPLMMALLSTNNVRGLEGSCVEEFCLPIFGYGLLCFLDFIMDRRAATWRRSLAIGICLGLLLWTKFSLWEFFFIPMLIWFIINLVRRNFVQILRSGLIMLGGILLVTIPIIIGYAVVGGLNDLFNVYFKLNLSSYHGDWEPDNLAEKIDYLNQWQSCIVYFFSISYYFPFVMTYGLIGFAVKNWRQKSAWLLLITVIPTWIMIGFFCGFFYYYIPMFTYAVLGNIYAIKTVAHILQAVEITIKRRWVSVVMLAISIVASFLVALPLVRNLTEINRPRKDYAPLVVADMIADYNRENGQNATLFCYHMVDWGFYNAAGVVPSMRFYAKNTFAKDVFPEMFDGFDNTIREQTCDFVVVFLGTYLQKETLFTPYYHPYLGTLEQSTLPFVYYDSTGYLEAEIVILLRN